MAQQQLTELTDSRTFKMVKHKENKMLKIVLLYYQYQTFIIPDFYKVWYQYQTIIDVGMAVVVSAMSNT